MFDPAFYLYAMECEGDLPTRQGKINKVIKILAAVPDPNDFEVQCMAYDYAGLNSDTLSPAEIQYMENEIAKRRR